MVVRILTVLASGVALGLAATDLVLDRRYDPAAVRIGPWIMWPKVGTADIDPYARAIMAQSGQVPLAAAEGVLLVARTDQTGDALVGRCTYRVDGGTLPARLWSLSVTDIDGRVARNAIGRSGFTSLELLRRSDGSFAIELATSARPGNWLPVPAGSFSIALHLYDSPLGSPSAKLADGRPAQHQCGGLPIVIDRIMPTLLWGLAVLFVAILVHISSILIVPRLAQKDAFAAIERAPAANRTIDGEQPVPVDVDFPFQDPALASAVCPYDLSTNPLRVTVPIDAVGFAAVSVHSRSGTVFYALTDRASIEGRIELLLLSQDLLERAEAADSGSEPARDVRVTSPTPDGFVEFDMLPRVGGHAEAESALRSVRCKVEASP